MATSDVVGDVAEREDHHPAQAVVQALVPAASLRRLRREFEMLQRARQPYFVVRPSNESFLKWHFVLWHLPPDTPYADGCYHGHLQFPLEYPLAPPALFMTTPNGRLEVGQRLCLSMTDFHPESWNPAWSMETILVGLVSHFVSDSERGYGAISATPEKRKKLALESWEFNAKNAEFKELFPEVMTEPTLTGSAVGVVAAGATSDVSACGFASPINKLTNVRAAVEPVVQAGQLAASMAGLTGDDEDGGNSEPEECWICRDGTDNEPLIQPCACRGSMSGVHASCIEQWINRHRRDAHRAEAPRCPACHQPYSGSERIPGLRDFARMQCRACARQLLVAVLRSVLLVGALTALEAASRSGSDAMPLYLRIPILTLVAMLALHKTIVLLVSLPPHRLPPRNRFALRFYVADAQMLATHFAEAYAAVTMVGLLCLIGALPWPYGLPFVFLGLLPAARLVVRQNPSLACIRRGVGAALAVFVVPFVLVWSLGVLLYRHPKRILHPLGAGWHLIVALAAVPMCLIPDSNVPVTIMWAIHSLLCLVGLVECLFIGKLEWKLDLLWLISVQATLLSAYLSNTLCVFYHGFGEDSDATSLVVLVGSAIWLLSVASLAVGVNRSALINYYRTWQHRHGTFRLHSGGGGGEPLATPLANVAGEP